MESTRAREIQPFIAMDILEKAYALERAGRDIVHLEIGEPDLDMPAVAREAAERALRNGWTHYTHSLGIWELREAIAERYASRYGVSISPERIIVTAGASGAFLLLFGVLFDPGSRVLLSDPGYPCYVNFARFVGAEPVSVPVEADDGFALTPDRIGQELENDNVRGVVISSPANPTGTVTPRGTYEWLVDQAPTLISDEIYHGLRYNGGQEFTALEIDGEAIVIDGMSKRYAMTGMRVGWMAVPDRLVRAINKISQNLFISVGSVSQHAAVAALREGEPDVERMVGIYRERHDYLVRALREIGFKVEVVPQGAFYVFARMSHLHPDSYEFCLKMLEEAGVAATPGVDFGRHRTREYVRFAYTSSLDSIREGVRRLEGWLHES
jgi:aspartate/methionine/tyrosine aminotransferase